MLGARNTVSHGQMMMAISVISMRNVEMVRVEMDYLLNAVHLGAS